MKEEKRPDAKQSVVSANLNPSANVTAADAIQLTINYAKEKVAKLDACEQIVRKLEELKVLRRKSRSSRA